MIWTCIAYAGIEIISIPAYALIATRVQIILYALMIVTLAQAYIVNRPSHAIGLLALGNESYYKLMSFKKLEILLKTCKF